jgi:23S rRNA pseudouridine1911/1915/1917 synthase
METFDIDHEEALYEHHNFLVAKGQEPVRIDKYLMGLIENVTRNKIQQTIDQGGVFANDVMVKSNYKVKPNDVIKVLMPHPTYEQLLVPENIPIDIIFEDEHVLVVNKPAGMVVHPGHGNYSGTLVNALAYHFENLPMNSSERPGLVHRIDKDTSGLLVVAKTELAMAYLTQQFANKTSEREYVALVWGNVKVDEGTIVGAIGRHPKDRMLMSVCEDESQGRPAVTHYKVLERLGYVTCISCRLETGRTHQIRVHMKHIGNTLFNDERYGGNLILKGTTFTKYKQFVDNCFKTLPRQALHARTLGFEHPITKEFMRFESDIPQDFMDCLQKWRVYSKAQAATFEEEED